MLRVTGGMCWCMFSAGRRLRRRVGRDRDLKGCLLLCGLDLCLDDLSTSESGAVEGSDGEGEAGNTQLEGSGQGPASSTRNRLGNGYMPSSSAGGADSLERFAGAFGEDWYSYPGVDTSELTL